MGAPDEEDVDDGDEDEPGGDRPGGCDVRDEAGDGDRGECDERDRRGLRNQAVGPPGDEPQTRREGQPQSSRGGEERGPDRAGPGERVRAAQPQRGDAAAERNGRQENPDEQQVAGVLARRP